MPQTGRESVEGQQGAGIELHARLAEGRRGDAIGQRLVVEYLEEAVESFADTALAQVQQHGHPMRQRQCALAGESFGMDAGEVGKFRRVQEIRNFLGYGVDILLW